LLPLPTGGVPTKQPGWLADALTDNHILCHWMETEGFSVLEILPVVGLQMQKIMMWIQGMIMMRCQ
jgi:hypothetical protein